MCVNGRRIVQRPKDKEEQAHVEVARVGKIDGGKYGESKCPITIID
jgi:hypothetical protein